MLLQEKVAVITGASRGLGAAIARRFGGEGAAVERAIAINERKSRGRGAAGLRNSKSTKSLAENGRSSPCGVSASTPGGA